MQLCECARESVCALSQPGGPAGGHGSLACPTSIKKNKASLGPMKEQVGTGFKFKGPVPHWGLKYAKEISNQIIIRSAAVWKPGHVRTLDVPIFGSSHEELERRYVPLFTTLPFSPSL